MEQSPETLAMFLNTIPPWNIRLCKIWRTVNFGKLINIHKTCEIHFQQHDTCCAKNVLSRTFSDHCDDMFWQVVVRAWCIPFCSGWIRARFVQTLSYAVLRTWFLKVFSATCHRYDNFVCTDQRIHATQWLGKLPTTKRNQQRSSSITQSRTQGYNSTQI